MEHTETRLSSYRRKKVKIDGNRQEKIEHANITIDLWEKTENLFVDFRAKALYAIFKSSNQQSNGNC